MAGAQGDIVARCCACVSRQVPPYCGVLVLSPQTFRHLSTFTDPSVCSASTGSVPPCIACDYVEPLLLQCHIQWLYLAANGCRTYPNLNLNLKANQAGKKLSAIRGLPRPPPYQPRGGATHPRSYTHTPHILHLASIHCHTSTEVLQAPSVTYQPPQHTTQRLDYGHTVFNTVV
jgi:hypothetical protein